ncbi:glycosyl hydrolase family 28-related protein [Roseovarius sp.]|uniref:glycosyl hydrolase family 28-related protein n=1 Tax=Roseovarius sp. TaxID=1486281 RepID=UPI00261D5EEF|nr:glycosyl hydrolase family 28-related protein [Roseovarius sp.]MDM8166466.1 glycosyl hydrolase family 28-related protein [Roseovarius sp.]
MNKAVTDGIIFMPPAFASGLDVWSSGNGTPGSDTYDNSPDAAFVPSDADFGGALELLKTQSTMRLRYTGETPILPGCYLRIRARVKAISGALPDVRIAGWAGGAGGAHVTGVDETGPETTLTSYGDVVEISAIVGTGSRGGVDMAWGTEALYGHFGLDLTGPNGGVVRIDDIEIEDVTRFFLRDLIGVVDVRDYGAVGDGVTDDHAAFEAADAAADGRDVLVPEGTYYLGDSVTLQARARFDGTVTMPADKVLTLMQNFDLPGYIDAFGVEEVAFRKAFQSLISTPHHVELDMAGLKIDLREPVDLKAAAPDVSSFAQRRVISNGQFSVVAGPNWDTETVTSQASYTTSKGYELNNVTNVANIPVGSLVEGNGVGREVYVKSKNVGAGTIELSRELYDAVGTQNFTFRRFKYMLDFSGFSKISKFAISNVDFLCRGDCNGLLLPTKGIGFHLRDCWFTSPRERGVSSHGDGCQGMMIDRCQFLSDETQLLVPNRTSIGVNINANDVKIRHNRCTYFKHFAVVGGTSSVILGNHVFQGDAADVGPRSAGIVMAHTNSRATISGNYICDCSIEWTNEHDKNPGFSSEFSFSAMSITNNNFLSQSTAPSFNFIRVKPYGTGHFINGLNVTGNTFRLFDGNIDRVEGIDTSFAEMDFSRFRNITFTGNAFNNVNTVVENPLVMEHIEASHSDTWVVEPFPKLPFQAWARTVESVTPKGAIREQSGPIYWGMPYHQVQQGPNKDRVNLRWEKPVEGTVTIRLRIDTPA